MTTTLSWPSILQALQQSIPSDKIKTWVAPLQCHGLDAGVLHLSAPNAFFVQWIHKNYEPLILQALRTQNLECHTLKMSIHTIPTENIAIKNILPPVVATPAIAQANEFQTQLNPNFTFDSYIVGPHNRMAKALCEQLLGNNQTVYNPLMIHGSVGVGKTHLLQGLAHAALQQQPHKRVIYTTSEMFTNHFITALGKKQIDRFRAYYRSADILLIDDVQFFTNKKSTTQDFFQHAFNRAHVAVA